MPKRSTINNPTNISAARLKTLKKLEKNAVAKYNRLKRKIGANNSHLLPKIDRLKNYNNNLKTDYNRLKKEYQHITNRNNFKLFKSNYGVVIPDKQVKEYNKLLKMAKANKSAFLRKIGNLDFKIAGVPTGGKVKTHRVGFNFGMYPSKFPELKYVKGVKSFDLNMEALRKYADKNFTTSKLSLYKENYHKAIDNELLSGDPRTIEAVELLHNAVNEYSDSGFAMLYYSDSIADIKFVYSEESRIEKINALLGLFEVDYAIV